MKTKKKIQIIKTTFALLLLIFYLFLTSCDTTNPPGNHTIALAFEDASCTEAWINLKLASRIALPTEIKLFKNDSLVISKTINSNDTTLFVENLLPNQTYNFQASCIEHPVHSNKLPVTTMDTTSHNFTWQTFTFGGVNGSSYLKDVAIINENNIWAVGKIHTAETDQWNEDSTKWLTPYNAVHWDGNTWELKRIMFYIDPFQPGAGRTASEAISIFSFSENDFVVSSNAQIAFFNIDGNYVVKKIDFKWENLFTINSIWGTSSKDFYVVGNGGNIAHYNGSSWKKIESGTELEINDIWGDYNDKTDRWEILAVASNVHSSLDKEILKINDKKVTHLSSSPISGTLRSIWFISNKIYYIVGAGVFQKHSLKEETLWVKNVGNITPYYTNKIRGNKVNDIIEVGGYGDVVHFNGVSWKSYFNKTKVNGNHSSVDTKGDITVVVGQDNPSGVIIMGKR